MPKVIRPSRPALFAAMLMVCLAHGAAADETAVVKSLAVQSIRSLLNGKSRRDLSDFNRVRSRYECVYGGEVRADSAVITGTRAAVEVTVHATVRMRGTNTEHDFPSKWSVQLRRSQGTWRVDELTAGESAVAVSVANENDATKQRAIALEHADLVTPELARRIDDLALQLNDKGQYDRARQLAETALVVAQWSEDAAAISRATWMIGRATEGQNLSDDARAFYDQARGLAISAGETEIVAASNVGLASIDFDYGDTARAREEGKAGLHDALAAGSERIADNALLTLGILDYGEGRYVEALRDYEGALIHAQRARDRVVIAAALANIGLTHDLMNNHLLAVEYLQRAIVAYRAAGNMKGVTRNLANLADIEQSIENYAAAAAHIKRVEALLVTYPNERTRAFVEATKTKLAIDRHDYAAARRLCEHALELAKKISSGRLIAILTYTSAEIDLRLHQYQRAIEACEKAIETASTGVSNFDLYWHAKYEAGLAYAKSGRLADARRSYTDAIAAIEGTLSNLPGGGEDEQHFLEDKSSPYYALMETYLPDDPGTALAWLERARVRTLRGYLARSKTNPTKTLTESERQQEAVLDKMIKDLNVGIRDERGSASPNHARLEQLERELKEARLGRSELRARLYANHPELSIARADVAIPQLNEAQRLIPPDGAVLEYASGLESTWLFVITHDGTAHAHRLPFTAKQLGRAVSRFSAQLTAEARYRDDARRLFDALLGPARRELASKHILCIIADGALWRLPFQTLIARDGGFLIERHPIFYAPSVALLSWYAAHSRPRQPNYGTPEILAVGNPEVGSETAHLARSIPHDASLAALPDAEREVKAIASIYGGDDVTVMTGRNATETQFKRDAGRYRVLHLATHAFFDDANPMYSYLVLSRAAGDPDDGILEAREVIDLDLVADVVVLSGCETGRVQVRGGEGMIGMSWALLAAGTPASVLSQFRVPSASTTMLMIAFHRALRTLRATGGSGASAAATALQRAQITMLRNPEYRHPFHWAGFITLGEW